MRHQSMIDPAIAELGRPQPRRKAVVKPATICVESSQSSNQIHHDDILKDYRLAVERAQTWTGLARFAFNAMLAAPEYKNKLRLQPEKRERIVFFLTVPDARSREKDRADAQAKHQSQQWIYQNGSLYRKETRLRTPRRHVTAEEVFDVLTAEHLRSGHQGRDKMLKVLEVKYIGYTKDELMFVLDQCLVCSTKHIRGAAARRREHKQGVDLIDQNDEMGMEMTSTSIDISTEA